MSLRIEHIGDATLYLGDCAEILAKLPTASAEMIWTDPPYGHSNHEDDLNSRLNDHRSIQGRPIQNDDPESMRRIINAMLKQAVRILRDDACCCCCCGGGGGPKPTFAWLAERMDRDGLSFFHSVIWNKKNPGLGWRYRRQHEMVMIAHRAKGKLLWHDNAIAAPNIFEIMPPTDRQHPNEKPVPLICYFLRLHSSPGHTIIDPFMGSGTTGVACAKMGRKFVGIEIDETYFDMACRRIEAAYAQADLFVAPPPSVKPEQGGLL
jgi:site-specific DNA-methyltransferase (adenine-specific)